MLQDTDCFCKRHILHLTARDIHVTAAAQMLHDNLHVHFVDRTRGDENLILIFGQNKACLDPFNIQQLVGCLRADNCRTLNALPGTDRDRVGIPVDLRL